MTFLKRVPLPMSALALGLAGLGNLLGGYSPSVRSACGVVSALIIALVLARAVLDFTGVRRELDNPAVLAVMPTLFMASMLLATYLTPFSPVVAQALWTAALVAQLWVVALFVRRFATPLRREAVLPSWFLVSVGFVVATVTSPAVGMMGVGRWLLPVGVAGYLVMLPIVVGRLVKGGPLPVPALPTLAILMAPPSLCLVGYLAVTPNKLPSVVYIGLAFALASLAFVLLRLPRILRTPFTPAYAALTFPAVITATAVKQSSAFLSGAVGGSVVPVGLVFALEALAALAVGYVLARYVVFFAAPRPQKVLEAQPASS